MKRIPIAQHVETGNPPCAYYPDCEKDVPCCDCCTMRVACLTYDKCPLKGKVIRTGPVEKRVYPAFQLLVCVFQDTQMPWPVN